MKLPNCLEVEHHFVCSGHFGKVDICCQCSKTPIECIDASGSVAKLYDRVKAEKKKEEELKKYRDREVEIGEVFGNVEIDLKELGE